MNEPVIIYTVEIPSYGAHKGQALLCSVEAVERPKTYRIQRGTLAFGFRQVIPKNEVSLTAEDAIRKKLEIIQQNIETEEENLKEQRRDLLSVAALMAEKKDDLTAALTGCAPAAFQRGAGSSPAPEAILTAVEAEAIELRKALIDVRERVLALIGEGATLSVIDQALSLGRRQSQSGG